MCTKSSFRSAVCFDCANIGCGFVNSRCCDPCFREGFILNKLKWLLGDPERPQEYTHHILLLAGILMYLSAAVFNTVFLTAPFEFNIALVAVGFAHILLFYFSRFRGQFLTMSLLFLAIVIIVLLPANWIFNGGSEGPTLLLFLIAAFYLSYLLTDYPKSRYFFMSLVLVVPAFLVFSETRLDHLIYRYPSEQAKQLDLMFSYVITVAMSVFIMKTYGKRYRLQREKSDRLAQQLKVLAETDPLTRLYNRNAFTRLYENIDKKTDYSLAILDLDFFKRLNDRFGHQVGDEILVEFAKELESTSDASEGMTARYGGEEFLLLLKKPVNDSLNLLENFSQNLNLFDPQSQKLTFSAGLVALNQNEELSSAVHRADIQLYKAKSQGRDCICFG